MHCTIALLSRSFFFLSNKKKEENRKRERQRTTPTSWSVVRYVVEGEVDECVEQIGWSQEMVECYGQQIDNMYGEECWGNVNQYLMQNKLKNDG